jgi:hypothetical protein
MVYRRVSKMRKIVACTAYVCLLLVALATPGLTQDEKDDTGTNPVNFTYDFRFITELRWLPDNSGSVLRHTLEWRAPLGKDIGNLGGGKFYDDLGKTFGIRMRAKYQTVSVNDASSPFGSSSVSGIGNIDARVLWLAHATPKWAVATGLEAFFNTQSNDFLGNGKTTLGPTVFLAFFGIFGKGSLFAPGYQYIFDVAGDPDRNSVSRSQIDIYGVWVLAGGKYWLTLDPQIIINHVNNKTFATIDAEWGFMIVPQSGISGYVRPGVGVGEERFMDWNLEFALKFVWR